MFKITYTKRFQKHYRKLSPFEKNQIKKTVSLLSTNPNHPSLRSKSLKGKEGIFESSANMRIRIIWFYDKEQIIYVLDILQHDDLNTLKI